MRRNVRALINPTHSPRNRIALAKLLPLLKWLMRTWRTMARVESAFAIIRKFYLEDENVTVRKSKRTLNIRYPSFPTRKNRIYTKEVERAFWKRIPNFVTHFPSTAASNKFQWNFSRIVLTANKSNVRFYERFGQRFIRTNNGRRSNE